MDHYLILLSLGFVVGIFSGLLGIGGGLLIIPALLYIYPWLSGGAAFGIKEATGISAIQSVAGSMASGWTHYNNGNVPIPLVVFLASTTMIGAYLGGLTTNWYSSEAMGWIYVLMLSLMLGLSIYNNQRRQPQLPSMSRDFPFQWVNVKNRKLSLFLALGIGYLSGLMGIGGAVLLIPLMRDLMSISLRVAIGSSSAIIFLSAICTALGKWHSNLIPVTESVLIAVGAVTGGYLGARLNKRFSENSLFWMLMAVIFVTLIRMTMALF